LFVAYKDKLSPIIACALSFFYAITDEIHQIFVPDRACQLQDMLIDLAGIVSGFIVYALIYILVRKTMTKFKIKH
ncbi:MAG: VanZ family protein, partial [Clostridia bacterium]|nr:VanZ family protein [Clostridia bacterium]